MNLANKYRPKCWDDVVEQDEIKKILEHQLETNDIRNAYLFVGGAGTGKTTCARIFANKLNEGKGSAIEIDGASNNGVDDVRDISQQAYTASTTSKYKVFIVDECHMVTIQGWNAMLKLIEEPPANTIFIFCTTNPEKVPKTILSRVQRYDFSRITRTGIITNLISILIREGIVEYDVAGVEYLAKLADGHMRDAITMMDKCLSYGKIEYNNITKALGLCYHEQLKDLMLAVINSDDSSIVKIIEDIYLQGNDLNQFIKQELIFALDYSKWRILKDMKYCSCPDFCKEWFENMNVDSNKLSHFINTILKSIDIIKYDDKVKTTIEAVLLLESSHMKGEI